MASKLKAVAPKEAKAQRAKILFYGQPGVGKTWAALDFPAPYFIDTEGGATGKQYTDKLKASNGVYLGIEQGSLSMAGIIEQVQALATEKHHYKTLVIDSITSVFNGEIANEAERLKRERKENAFGADKKPAVGLSRSLVNWLKRLDMNVILIAHEKSEWGLDASGQRTEIGKTFDGWEKLAYELDLSLNISKTAGQRKAFVKKSRLEAFPDASSFPWSYMEFAKKFGVEIINKDSQEITLATTDQIMEINGLIAMAKVPQKTVDDWFTKANVSEWAEMSSNDIGKIIAFINSKIQPTE